MKRLTVLLSVFSLVSLLSACGSAAFTPASSPTKTAPVSTPTPTKEVITSPIVGTYSTTISKQDIASMPDRSPDLGTYAWSFNDNGTYNWIFYGPNGFNSTGHYQVSQGELSITDSVCATLLNAPMAGKYSWVLKGNILIFQVKDDGCLDRKFVLTVHPLLRKGS